MSPRAQSQLPACLRGFAGAALELALDGIVIGSNGRLDGELGIALIGRRFSELLDAGSSQEKWQRALAAPSELAAGGTWELVLRGENTLPDPRTFSVLWNEEAETLWLLEHPRDDRRDRLQEQIAEVNSELANTQRELLKEQGRLAHALAELERSNRELDAFAYVISHDLKAPLRAVANYSRFLEEDLTQPLTGESREHMDRLRDRVEQMRAMIDGVLAYARAGHDRGDPEPVRTEQLVEQVVELLSPPAEVAIEIDPDMPTLVTERAPLRQVFLNLIGNAIKYAAGPAARVRVGSIEAGAFHEFFVQDNGKGIPPAQQDKIWTLFHTLEPNGNVDGTGIGLAVVKKLVEAQHGRVWVESSEGAGTTFRFRWPKNPGQRLGFDPGVTHR